MALIIHATNVHGGGGSVLLLALLQALEERLDCKVILDSRLRLPFALPEGVAEIRVNPSLLARLKTEWLLRTLAKQTDTVLCFGNLPPLFKTAGKVFLFIQNRYLVGHASLAGFTIFKRLQIYLERLWLKFCVRHADTIIVQTPSMQYELLKTTGIHARVLPFSENVLGYERCRTESRFGKAPGYDFVYVASGEPHKNHINLIEAWKLLAERGYYPSLCFTVSKEQFPELCFRIDVETAKNRLKIENHPGPPEQVHELYAKAGALIYPSTLESLGLPLIEARKTGLPVIASELDYVRDIIDPEQSFDPGSPVSIARAVQRHLGKSEKTLPLISAGEFIRQILAPPA